MDEREVIGEAGETWTICVPRMGAPNKAAIQGVPVFTFVVSPSMGDEVERSMRALSPSLRRGRPMVYRGDREILPERPEESEERELLAARATASDPHEAAAMFEAVSLKALSRELSLETERKRQELASLERRIEAARQAVADEQERQRKAVEKASKHGQDLVASAAEHYEKELRRTWRMEEALEEKGLQSMRRMGEQQDLVIKSKQQIDSIMRSTTIGEMMNALKGHLEVAFNSPIGKSIGLAVSAKLASVIAARTTGRAVTTEDALASLILQGAEFRQRQGELQEMLVAAPDAARRARAQGLVLGATYVAGGCPPNVVAEYIGGA